MYVYIYISMIWISYKRTSYPMGDFFCLENLSNSSKFATSARPLNFAHQKLKDSKNDSDCKSSYYTE